MKLALDLLGLGPCHHMTVLIDDPVHAALWDSLGQGATPDWDHIFAGFHSAVDWPAAYYWQDISNRYPDAKVLLTLRSPESWWNSYSQTIMHAVNRMRGSGIWLDAVVGAKVMGGHPDDRATAIAAFNANTARVRALVPPHRLIVHETGDGWGPLCEGLGLAIPAEPYPKTNTKQEFLDRRAAQVAAAAASAATQK